MKSLTISLYLKYIFFNTVMYYFLLLDITISRQITDCTLCFCFEKYISSSSSFSSLILKFAHITFCLMAELQTVLKLKILMAFYVKLLLSLCILLIHCSFEFQVLIDLVYFSHLKFFWVLASSLVIVL